ncbi:MAG: flagellar basal body P-ring formation chaperone FlgA, partial [Gammaproteobacteria bacterium]
VSHFMRTYIRDYPKQSGQEISYTIEQLDLRITLNPCETPLVVAPYQRQPTSATSKITLQIACSAPKRWRLFVPVNIQITDRVVVAQVATPRNTTLTANELGYQYLDVSRLRQDYFRDIHAITGYSTRQFLRQGAIVSRHLVTPPRVVHKNQTVNIVATGELLAVKATGTALSDGKVGDWIRVKNSSSKRIVEGRVTANGSIEITH